MADFTTFITTLAAEDFSGSTGPSDSDVDVSSPQPSHIRFHNVTQVLIPLVMAIITVIGISGNSIVLYIIIRHREMQNITNFFIANLAVTDIALLVMCTIPTAANIAGILPISDAMCKGVSYMQFVSIFVLIGLKNTHHYITGLFLIYFFFFFSWIFAPQIIVDMFVVFFFLSQNYSFTLTSGMFVVSV